MELSSDALASYSLRRRLVWLLLIAVVLTAMIQAAAAYRAAVSEADEIFDYQMQQIALALRTGRPRGPEPEASPSRVEDADFDFLTQVYASDGSLVFASKPSTTLPRAPRAGFSGLIAHGKRYRVFLLEAPARAIQVAQDVDARRDLVGDLVLRIVGPVMLLAPALMLAVWWVVTRSTRPLERAREQIASRAADELAPVLVPALPDEVRPLVDEINLLFIRLNKAFDAQKTFVANAAHEMRSPLAALRLQIQGMLRAADSETRAVAARRLLAGVDRTGRLVEQMLVLARQDAVAPAARSPIDLRAAIGLAIGDVVASAQSRQIDIGMADAGAAWITGELEALRILFRNLLENAVKYTPVQGTVNIAIRNDGAHSIVEIADSGPGIAEQERERVFERFYRVPGANADGTGLGLAIVQTIAHRHRAMLNLDESRLGGLAVTITFPAASSPVSMPTQ